MKKIIASIVIAGTLLAGCADLSETAVSGRVINKNIENECKTSHAMAPVVFKKSGKGNGGGSKPKSPKKTEREQVVPEDGPDIGKPKTSCKNKYELVIKNKDGVFKEKVTSSQYKKCAMGESFPGCAK